jgi:hypothetical protein
MACQKRSANHGRRENRLRLKILLDMISIGMIVLKMTTIGDEPRWLKQRSLLMNI